MLHQWLSGIVSCFTLLHALLHLPVTLQYRVTEELHSSQAFNNVITAANQHLFTTC